jgi:hypothetical protein
MKRLYLVLILAGVSTSAPALAQTGSSPAPAKKSFVRRVADRLRVTVRTYQRLTTVRGSTSSLGSELVVLSLPNEVETVVWVCSECWSPAVLDSATLGVLRPDGLWAVPRRGGSPRLALASTEIERLLDPVDDRSGSLFVLIRAAAPAPDSCRYLLRIANLDDARLELPPDSLEECVESRDVAGLSAFRNDRFISTTDAYNPAGYRTPRRLRVSGPIRSNRVRTTLLTPRLNALRDGLDRFEPIWLDDIEVAYIRRRWP